MNGFKQSKIAIMVAGGIAFSGPLQAALIDNGNGFIYDTVKNITWTQDANLLGTMAASNPNLVDQIISANNGVIHDLPSQYYGTYNLSYRDFVDAQYNIFSTLGTAQVNWWGAQAFTNYLNSISYGGSSQWRLPATDTICIGFNCSSSDLGELFYNELGGIPNSPIPTGPFSNVEGVYWSNEVISNPSDSWIFYTCCGNQDNYQSKSYLYYNVWAVSPGNVGAPVPIPGAVWLFGSGLGFLALKTRRKIQA